MTILVDDPLIAGTTISRPLPLHESSARLRKLDPECPRVYGVAVMADVGRRRWWPLASVLASDRLRRMFASAAREMDSRAAASQLAAALAYTVVGRVVALVILEGRAWDPGLENLWVHCDSEGAIDWAGVVDATLRVLPNDPVVDDSVVRLPGEAALATWTAHRCHRAPSRRGGHTTCRHSGVLSAQPEFGKGFDHEIGLTILEVTPDEGRARLDIHDKLLQPWGIVHGGVYCSIIESLSSVCGHVWLSENGGGTVVGVNNNTDFLRAISSGTVYAVATPVHRGRRQQLWVTTITDENDRVVARGQVRLQNLADQQGGP